MNEVIEKVETANEFFGSIQSHTDGDFVKMDTLWEGTGEIRAWDVLITATVGKQAVAKFKVLLDVPGQRAHYISSGRKHDMLDDYFHGDTPREFRAKLQRQIPRDPKLVVATYEWMTKELDNAKELIANHKKAFKGNDMRLAFVRKVS